MDIFSNIIRRTHYKHSIHITSSHKLIYQMPLSPFLARFDEKSITNREMIELFLYFFILVLLYPILFLALSYHFSCYFLSFFLLFPIIFLAISYPFSCYFLSFFLLFLVYFLFDRTVIIFISTVTSYFFYDSQKFKLFENNKH